jgi:hypothetical protein
MSKELIKCGLLFESAVLENPNPKSIFSAGLLRRISLVVGKMQFEFGLLHTMVFETSDPKQPTLQILSLMLTNDDGYCDHIYPLIARTTAEANDEIQKILLTNADGYTKTGFKQENMELFRNPFFNK